MSEIQTITVAGKDALAELDRLRQRYRESGLYPILLGDDEEYDRLVEGLEEDFDVTSILAKSHELDPLLWFREKVEFEPELYESEEDEWPEPAPDHMGIITHCDISTGKPLREVRIGLFKVSSSWEVFAHLNWGNWNDCPAPAEHCAIHRYWQSKYGTEVVSVTGDIVQCVVSRPPKDRESSLHLAHEQYVYCYDIVDQGVQSIAALAATLLDSRHWYFWWD